MIHTNKLVLPDLISACPFKWAVNPHYARARDESACWIESFGVFSDRKRAIFKVYNSELLPALTYSYAGYEELRTCCDFVNLLFAFDEISDELGGDESQKLGVILLKALGGEFTKDSVLSKIAGEFRARFVKKAGPKCQERFLARCAGYILAVCQEAELRKNGTVLKLDSYMGLRRENSAVQTCFGLFEYVHGIELPDKVFEDEVFTRMYWQGIDMVCLSNDLYSFSMERAKGLDGNNFVTVAMRDKGLTIQQAADNTGAEFLSRLHQFIEDRKVLPSFGKGVDDDVQKYIFSISQWCIGNLIWSFETPRYFGAEREEVKKTRVVHVKNHGEDADAHLVD